MNSEILGVWKIDPNDTKAQQMYGDVFIEFKTSGELIYTIQLKGREQKIFMTYEIKDALLITNQPTSSSKEETKFKLLSDKKLELCFGGIKSKYIKELF